MTDTETQVEVTPENRDVYDMGYTDGLTNRMNKARAKGGDVISAEESLADLADVPPTPSETFTAHEMLDWLSATWPAGSGSDFNQGVVRGYQIVQAQLRYGHVTRNILSQRDAIRTTPTASPELVETARALKFEIGPRFADYPATDYADATLTLGQWRTIVSALQTTPSQPMIDALREEIINTPETQDFMAGVPIEATHQRGRWGSEHDAGKGPLDWFWLIGYLSQKAATAQMAGDMDKAAHHTISSAAALANWHAQITGRSSAMRPGIEPPSDTLLSQQEQGT
ncbi:hypothetical protein HME9302_00940 [Alteripontixanthobacter maritimus]|uniref:Uncharacterized protein n=1 Tax=Alteripontixanthobacter maritimus TaxID=2161824 RepID=A0A369Q884_9SPHN|nr:hypothetical protein [Alteripontixanthobacter maritimus]RDC59745.1 hypothetical protein HME9302_00940 [Alteripontixanthobacter maritimus]